MTWLCSNGEIGEVAFVNLFAYRHRDPLALIALARSGVDVVGPSNDEHILAEIGRSDLVVVAWGAIPSRIDSTRASQVLALVKEPYCFGVNSGGSPIHPNRRGLSVSLSRRQYVGAG